MKPALRSALLALTLLGPATAALAAGPMLVTLQEMQQDGIAAAAAPRAAAAPAYKAFAPGVPQIEIRQPSTLTQVKAPFSIQLHFKANDDAEIDVKSFRVFYGFLKLDITERLLEKAQLTREGLSLDNAAIPSGSHKLLIRLRDSKAREGELEVAFKVL